MPVFDFGPFPALKTERLLLREVVPGDAQAIFALRSDYEVTRYNIGRAYTGLEQARSLIEDIAAGYATGSELRWGITLVGQERVIGMAGFNYWSSRDRRASIGFDLAREFWGKGIMAEALQAILRFGFESMALNRIEADTSAANAASIRLLSRLGFRLEGCQREQYFEAGRFHDLLIFALLCREFGA
ncbi:GNAT family N-acetyltransferase [Gloeobacter morelensis]|uniref:GNAT family N-acetyltransferase n=1 Tax=Gloeobacter morelensis MG652769 TaxID=2781736 RepID=A0ABY3PRK2_9CYAN|nr:GNAT family N-acetyltransferase [Gloeobacter morelensis]UFP96222.1 GNAT family N-acetyltransferase [Gloeobacter morelensis MG652769]